MKHWRETTEVVGRVLALASLGRTGVLATVVDINGSAYRRPGAKFLVEDDGRTLGGVSGGCLEADIREIAGHVIGSGAPRLLHYNTGSDDRTVWGLGLGCNGSVDVFVQSATDPSTLDTAPLPGIFIEARCSTSSPSGSARSCCTTRAARTSGVWVSSSSGPGLPR